MILGVMTRPDKAIEWLKELNPYLTVGQLLKGLEAEDYYKAMAE